MEISTTSKKGCPLTNVANSEGRVSQCVWLHTVNMCRALLSPWYEKGGMHPSDENDKPVFEGRCNLGRL